MSIMWLASTILWDGNGNIVWDCPATPNSCCGGGGTPGVDCPSCRNNTTPLTFICTFSGFDCCYGGAMNGPVTLTQEIGLPCQWEGTKDLGSNGVVTVRLNRELPQWTLEYLDSASGDAYAWVAPSQNNEDCGQSLTFPARPQPPSFGPCAACKDTISAVCAPG
jgi:hypothetical protein